MLIDEVYKPDYYDCSKNRVSLKLELGFNLEFIQNAIHKAHPPDRNQAIKNHSETFGTTWQNREGELSPRIIKKILNNKPFNNYFDVEPSKIYQSVFKLEELEDDIKAC